MVGFLGWLGSNAIVSRVQTIREPFDVQSGEVRLATFRDGLHMFADKPVTGWGLGVFPTAYPRYRSYYTNLFINEAHNDWLQVLIETGVVGFVLTLWFVGVVCWKGWRNSHRGPLGNQLLAMSALIGVTGILVHSVFDFNLHIPANAALFFTLCGCAVVTAKTPEYSRRTGIHDSRN
jgi:O-antigen ligase